MSIAPIDSTYKRDALFYRHDNDRKRPRTTAEIYELNQAMAKKMEDVFVRKGIPVVPTIGASRSLQNFSPFTTANRG